MKEMRFCCELQIEISNVHLVSPPSICDLARRMRWFPLAGADIFVRHFGPTTTRASGVALPVDSIKIDRSL